MTVCCEADNAFVVLNFCVAEQAASACPAAIRVTVPAVTEPAPLGCGITCRVPSSFLSVPLILYVSRVVAAAGATYKKPAQHGRCGNIRTAMSCFRPCTVCSCSTLTVPANSGQATANSILTYSIRAEYYSWLFLSSCPRQRDSYEWVREQCERQGVAKVVFLST